MRMPPKRRNPADLERLAAEVSACELCPRLVAWRREAAADPPRRYRGQSYWARPVPGFGDPAARVVVVGLAPAAHGANRTGRMFTGDRSGEWLYGALHRAGYANQPSFERADDGLRLHDAWITAVVRCAPPANKPTPVERDACLPGSSASWPCSSPRPCLLALGSFAWDGALRALTGLGHPPPRPKPRFGHGAEAEVGPYRLLGSFHPSQQNTFTGKLTREMLDSVLARARELAGAGG